LFMENQLEFVSEQFGKVRAAYDNGVPMLCGKDVCKALGIKNHHTSLALLDSDEKVLHTMDSPGGNQKLVFVTEAGIYRLIFKSRKPETKEFQRWVCHEVLPAIRKQGAYVKADEGMSDSDVMERAVNAANEAIAKLSGKITALQETIEEQKPKVLLADSISSADTDILVADLAKILCQNGIGFGEKTLYQWFRDNGYVCKRGKDNMPTQYAINLGLFRITERTLITPHHTYLLKTTKVTGKGHQYIVNLFCNKDSPLYQSRRQDKMKRCHEENILSF